jgi:hypothetical protein
VTGLWATFSKDYGLGHHVALLTTEHWAGLRRLWALWTAALVLVPNPSLPPQDNKHRHLATPIYFLVKNPGTAGRTVGPSVVLHMALVGLGTSNSNPDSGDVFCSMNTVSFVSQHIEAEPSFRHLNGVFCLGSPVYEAMDGDVNTITFSLCRCWSFNGSSARGGTRSTGDHSITISI